MIKTVLDEEKSGTRRKEGQTGKRNEEEGGTRRKKNKILFVIIFNSLFYFYFRLSIPMMAMTAKTASLLNAFFSTEKLTIQRCTGSMKTDADTPLQFSKNT